ncbi:MULTISPECIES: hypothetical protein [Persicobacter]|uniref:Uncharacterized protein n=1 Tax=Persicobacter diffluens TaxID=981 RepID=A0AAN4VVV7_9BACT|nr:hypothetical protein [Persicobacter sp. CCB-QB2]GJM60921.1 hypothetical protein PEDI_14730 [Persicobacter diffluens]
MQTEFSPTTAISDAAEFYKKWRQKKLVKKVTSEKQAKEKKRV